MQNQAPPALNSSSVLVAEQRPVCFMHIGKVGGHAISRELLNRYPLSDAYNGSPEQYDDLLPRDLLGKKLIIGHFSYGHSKKFPENRFLFSMVREPIDRVTSNYWYLRSYSGPHTETSQDMIHLAKTHDFDSFVRLNNLQVRQVVENHQCMFFAEDWRAAHRSADASLDAALAHLNEFDFIGVYEHYDESMQLLAALLGWLPWPSETRLNATPYRKSVSSIGADTLEYLRSANSLDLKLYDEITTRYRQHRQKILRELVRYRSVEASKKLTKPAPLVNEVFADLPFNGEGWNERTIVSGHYARWMQPATRVTLMSELECSRGGVAEIQVVGWSDMAALESLTLDVDGVRCERFSFNVSRNEGPEKQQAAVSFRLPASAQQHLELSLTSKDYADGSQANHPHRPGPLAVSAIRLLSSSPPSQRPPRILQKLKQTFRIG